MRRLNLDLYGYAGPPKRKGKVPVFNRGGIGFAALNEYETESSVDREVRDDGAGNWVGLAGSINYTTGEFSLRTEAEYQYKGLLR